MKIDKRKETQLKNSDFWKETVTCKLKLKISVGTCETPFKKCTGFLFLSTEKVKK
jgi:hypothetical protein